MRLYWLYKAVYSLYTGPIRLATFALSLLVVSNGVQALGLGNLELLSDPNQPLNAEIQIVSMIPGEADGLTASLASPQAFQRAGIDLTDELEDLQFVVVQSAGVYVISISSTTPFSEPVLEFLLQVEWRTGRLVRDYTVVMGPGATVPGQTVANVITDDDERLSISERSGVSHTGPQSIGRVVDEPISDYEIVDSDTDERIAEQSNYSALESAELDTDNTGDEREITVQSGDTLSLIAEKNAVRGVSVQELMVALLNANPDAFIDGNINLVKVGANLRIPDRSEFERLSLEQAVVQIDEQDKLWREYRDNINLATEYKIASAPENATSIPATSIPIVNETSAAAQRIIDLASVEVRRDKALKIVARSDSTLPLTSAIADNSEVSAIAQLGAINRKWQLAKEELTSTRLEKSYLADQSNKLQETIETIYSLVTIRQNEVARLQAVLARLPDESPSIDTEPTVETSADLAVDGISNPSVDSYLEPVTKNAFAEVGVEEKLSRIDSEAEPDTAIELQLSSTNAGFFQRHGGLIVIGLGTFAAVLVVLLLWDRVISRRTAVSKLEQNKARKPLRIPTKQAYTTEKSADWDAAMNADSLISVGDDSSVSYTDGDDATELDARLDALAKSAENSGFDLDETMTEVDEYIATGHYDVAEEILGKAIVEEQENDAYILKLLKMQRTPVNEDTSSSERVPNHTIPNDEKSLDWETISKLGYNLKSNTPNSSTATVAEYESISNNLDSLSPEKTGFAFDSSNAHAHDDSVTTEFFTTGKDKSVNYHGDASTPVVEFSKIDLLDTNHSSQADDSDAEENVPTQEEVLPAWSSTDNPNIESRTRKYTESTLQYKLVAALFLGWCLVAWIPKVTQLGGSDIGLAQLFMVAIVLCLWRVQRISSVDTFSYLCRTVICVFVVLLIAWAYLGTFRIDDLLGSGRLFVSLFQGLVLLYVLTSVLQLRTLNTGIQVCGVMVGLSVGLCIVAPYISGLDAIVFRGSERAYGLFTYQNQFSTVLAMGIPLAALLILNGRNTIVNIILLCLLFWGLAITGSKTNIVVALGVLLMVALYAIITSRHRIVLALVVLGIAIYIFVSGVPVLELVNPSAAVILQDVMTYGGVSADSVKQRTNLWDHAISVMANHPFFGEGPGHKFIANGELTNHSHNVFLDYGRSIGLPGAIGILVILSASLILAVRNIYLILPRKQTLHIILLAGSCFSIISFIFSNQLSDSFTPESSFFFWLSLGLVLRSRDLIMNKNVHDHQSKTDRPSFDTKYNESLHT